MFILFIIAHRVIGYYHRFNWVAPIRGLRATMTVFYEISKPPTLTALISSSIKIARMFLGWSPISFWYRYWLDYFETTLRLKFGRILKTYSSYSFYRIELRPWSNVHWVVPYERCVSDFWWTTLGPLKTTLKLSLFPRQFGFNMRGKWHLALTCMFRLAAAV